MSAVRGSSLTLALVALVLFTLLDSGLTGPTQKAVPCCYKVSTEEITEPILAWGVQEGARPCVTAVIFYTESGFHCSKLNAPWVRRKIQEFRRSRATPTPSPTVSLLSIITSPSSSDVPTELTFTSSSSPSSSPSPSSSSPPSSGVPAEVTSSQP